MTDDNQEKTGGNDEKTGWDKLGVIFQGLAAIGTLIAIPITVYYSVHEFNAQQTASASQTLNQQRQTTLDNYLNEMSTLELNDKLSGSKQRSPVNAIAVAQTDTAVRNLDSDRKGILIRYLWEANLITAPNPVITLYQVNLSRAYFKGANLSQVDLSTNDLIDANFAEANPNGADFSGANLSGADLSGADLSCIKYSPGISAGILQTVNPADVVCTSAPGGADMEGANLHDANLSDADLRGADLRGADLSGVNLKGATYNSSAMPPVKDEQGNILTVEPTQWPPGFNPASKGAIDVN